MGKFAASMERPKAESVSVSWGEEGPFRDRGSALDSVPICRLGLHRVRRVSLVSEILNMPLTGVDRGLRLKPPPPRQRL